MSDKVEIDWGVLMDACQFLAALAEVAPEAVPQVEAKLDCGPAFFTDLMARLAEAVHRDRPHEGGGR